MPTITGFSTKNSEKVKEALAYVKLPFSKKGLKKVVIDGIEYDPKVVGTKVEQPKEPKGGKK